MVSVHTAKDGVSYSSYAEMREANIRHNNQKLKEKGLDASSFRKYKRKEEISTQKRSIIKSRSAHASALSSPRRSDRVRKKPPEYEPLVDSELPRSNWSGERKKRKVAKPVSLTEEQRRSLSQSTWLSEFEEYLANEEKLSPANYRAVVRQVKKLVSGAGIRYDRWKEGTVFKEGQPTKLSDDMEALFHEATDFEDEHGKDLGNGKSA